MHPDLKDLLKGCLMLFLIFAIPMLLLELANYLLSPATYLQEE